MQTRVRIYVDSQVWNLYVLRFSLLIGLDGRSRRQCRLRLEAVATCLLELWDQIPSGNGCLSLLRDVCFGADFSATGQSLVQISLTEYGVTK